MHSFPIPGPGGRLLVAVALLLTAVPVQAQTRQRGDRQKGDPQQGVRQGVEPALPSAESVLDRHVAATGGREAHLAVSSRRSQGRLKIDMAGHKIDARVEKHARAPGCLHTVIESDFINQVDVTDGTDAWRWSQGHSPDQSTSKLLAGSRKDRLLENARFHGEVHWRELFAEVRTVGKAEVAGRPAYRVQVKTKSGETYSRFYDVESGRLVKSARVLEMRDEKMDSEVFYSDYRAIDGVWLPMQVQTVLHSPEYGRGTQTWIYQKVEHGVKIPAEMFVLPAGLREEKRKKADAEKRGTHGDGGKTHRHPGGQGRSKG